MTTSTLTTIDLTEYSTIRLQRNELDPDLAKTLYKQYGNRVTINEPSFTNDYNWELTSQGWVGHIPLSNTLKLTLSPKVPIQNLFRMLEYAWELISFEFVPSLFKSDSLDDFYQRLAKKLAQDILSRNRKGLYKEYLARDERLSIIRGRINLADKLRKPWDTHHECHFHEHSADLDDNRILAWTLFIILRTGLCTDRNTASSVRKAYRELLGKVGLQECVPKDAINRLYNRLNSDYKPLHSLCRFFLENTGPKHQIGDRTMLPFLVNMARLFELFVYEWMKKHLHEYFPSSYRVNFQQRINVDTQGIVHFDVDLIIQDNATGTTKCILDTKYKDADTPSSADVAQVIAYAAGKRCANAILVYPTQVNYPGGPIGDIIVSTLTFALNRDVDEAGRNFLQDLKQTIG